MRRRHLPWLWLLSFFVPMVAQAQEDPREEYVRVATEGQDAFNRGEFTEARRIWEHARSILPNPRIYRLLGRAADSLNDPVEAVRMYRLALTAPENGNPLTDARRQEVEQVLLRDALRRIGEITLELEPSDATVTVDGSAATMDNGALLLPVGTHTLTVRSRGYRPHERRIEVAAGSRETLQIALERGGAGADTGGDNAAPASSGQPDLVGPIVLFAVAGAGLVTFAVAGGLVLDENNRVAMECGDQTTTPMCTPVQLSQLRMLTAIADVGWVTGLVALAAGSVWLGVALSGGGRSETAMRVLPWASAEGAGVTAMGRF